MSGLNYLEINRSLFELVLEPSVRSPLLELATKRYQSLYLFDDRKPELKDDPLSLRRKRLGSLQRLVITATNQSKYVCESLPHSEMDESYLLRVDPPNAANAASVARLSAKSCWGLLRGLETFSQLIFNIAPGNLYAIQPVDVDDSPRFKHRGLMLDTARHYISVPTLMSILDAMSFNKLNVFHWHLVDDQSFPYKSSIYPQLAKNSAFRPEFTYSQHEIEFIVVYAASRGIRVMPEFDTPGHSYALRHIPNLLTTCYDSKTNLPTGDVGPVDPTKSNTYEVIDNFLKELNSIFPDAYFHAGGDEVEFDCWKSNPKVNKWMKDRNMSGNYEELSNYYMRQIYGLIKNYNKTMLVWQEVFDLKANLPKDSIVHVWKYINDRPAYMAELAYVVDAGYSAILSSCWYLNYIDYGQDWVKFYTCDPTSTPVHKDNAQRVLGGEICMWTEFVDDTNVISRIWPRASAAAERLWSPKEIINVQGFLGRLEQHRCRLTYRGINAEPVNGPGYC